MVCPSSNSVTSSQVQSGGIKKKFKEVDSWAKVLLTKGGSDGVPYLIKAIEGVSQIAIAQSLKNPLCLACVAITKELKPALKTAGLLMTPMKSYGKVSETIKTARDIFSDKGPEVRKKVKVKILAADSEEVFLEEAKGEKKERDGRDRKRFEVGAKGCLTLTSFIADSARATEWLCQIGAVQLASGTLMSISKIAGRCTPILTYGGGSLAIVNLCVAGYDYYKASGINDRERALLAFTLALRDTGKVALKVCTFVFVGFFSLTTQGVFTLVFVAIDVWVEKFGYQEKAQASLPSEQARIVARGSNPSIESTAPQSAAPAVSERSPQGGEVA